MADLEANLMHFQLMHESLTRFSESFASFLYGLNMNAFCVDYPEVRIQMPDMLRCNSSPYKLTLRPQGPIPESFRRAQRGDDQDATIIPDTKSHDDLDGDMTFMCVDLLLAILQKPAC